MLTHYLQAALLKSLKKIPSFSQNFDVKIFIILGNFFYGLGDFFVKKAAKNINFNNTLKFGFFSKRNVGTLKLRLAILPYLEET